MSGIDLTEAVEAAGGESTAPCDLCQHSTDGVALCGPCRDEAERMLTAALPHLEQQVREQVAAEAWDEGYGVGFYAREALFGDSRDASEGSGTNPYRARTRKDT